MPIQRVFEYFIEINIPVADNKNNRIVNLMSLSTILTLLIFSGIRKSAAINKAQVSKSSLISNFCLIINKFKDVDSGECNYDPGGYFIINGSEKVLISQDRMIENIIVRIENNDL